MNWIDFRKLSPDLGGEYLCVFIGWDDLKVMRVLSFDSMLDSWYDDDGERYLSVTHWRKLPKFPNT